MFWQEGFCQKCFQGYLRKIVSGIKKEKSVRRICRTNVVSGLAAERTSDILKEKMFEILKIML